MQVPSEVCTFNLTKYMPLSVLVTLLKYQKIIPMVVFSLT